VITGVETKETLERWVFNVETDKAAVSSAGCVPARADAAGCVPAAVHARGVPWRFLPHSFSSSVVKHKSHKEIQSEIQAIIRQITASVTFLPLLEEACTFDLLVYADEAAAIPRAWEESDPRYIAAGASTEVRLRSFTTSIHKVRVPITLRCIRQALPPNGPTRSMQIFRPPRCRLLRQFLTGPHQRWRPQRTVFNSEQPAVIGKPAAAASGSG